MSIINIYDYSNINDFEKSQLPDGFYGNVFNISYKWLSIIPEPTEPIKIMEIGAYHGANICSYIKSYAKHENTEIHCVDPWCDYNGYNEYLTKQSTNYSIFLNNISKLNSCDINKIYIHRGLSEKIVPLFQDESYDIIYIDGNHEKRYVLDDAVMSFKKIKKGGWIIFDDIHDKEVSDGLQAFLSINSLHFEDFKQQNSQFFMRRTML